MLLIPGPLHQFSVGSKIYILMTLWNCFGFWCIFRKVRMMALFGASSPTTATSALVSATHCKQVWSPPAGSVFKVSVDGAVFAQQRKSGVGVVIRNCEGLLMGALSMKLNQQLGSLEIRSKIL